MPIVLPVHVLDHPTAGTLVVDTGIDSGLASGGPGPLRGLVRALGGTMEPVASLDDILAGRDPDMVLLTHAHLDHVLGLPDVAPDVPIVVGPGELEARDAQNALMHRTYARLWDDRTAVMDLDPEAATALGPVSHAWDLLGDGSLYALWMPGHTPGSLAFLARTTEGPVLFAGDTCHTLWGWEHDVPPGKFTADAAGNRRALDALKALEQALPDLVVHVGHELQGRPDASAHAHMEAKHVDALWTHLPRIAHPLFDGRVSQEPPMHEDHVVDSSPVPRASLAPHRALTDFGAHDDAALRDLSVHLDALCGPILDTTFDHIQERVDMAAVLGARRSVQSLKGAQKHYLASLISETDPAAHARLLERIGQAHHIHQIPPRWHPGFTSRLLRALLGLVVDTHTGDPDAMKRDIDAVVKAMFVDMAFILDEYDHAGRSQAVDTIQGFGAQMKDANGVLIANSESLAESLQQHSKAATEQASAIAEVTSTLGELSQTSAQALHQADSMVEAAEEARVRAQEGRAVVAASIDSIDSIRDRVATIQDKPAPCPSTPNRSATSSPP